MTPQQLAEILILLGATVAAVLALRRVGVPSALAYLLVGFAVGPHTPGPVLDPAPLRPAAELGVVFLLFTIGLGFSLPRSDALRHLVLAFGAAQVALTTLVFALGAWALGLPPAAAFVIGAVAAQSSTTVIERQLAEQGEDRTQPGQLAIAMSVFQDVTAAPFVVVIPALAGMMTAGALGIALGLALAKAAVALALVLAVGRWLLPPMFRLVARGRSTEVFTLTALLVVFAAAAVTQALGLSMAFGAFLAGLTLGSTEFRHQVESAIRPFRDVLVGLFFVGVGMLLDPAASLRVWPWAVGGALVLLAVKALLVAAILRAGRVEASTAWRTGIALAVGGEFGFALLALALDADVMAADAGQAVLSAVLLSMVLAPFLIRHNAVIAARLARSGTPVANQPALVAGPSLAAALPPTGPGHVIVCGYGRIGQNVARFLAEEGIPYLALDLDARRVEQARLAGEPVFYADAAERDILQAVGVMDARLVVVSHDDLAAALKTLHHVRALRPEVPVMVRTRDEAPVDTLRAAGATEVVPETLEAGLMIATHALLLLQVLPARIVERLQKHRRSRYRLLRELYAGEDEAADPAQPDRLRPVVVAEGSAADGRTLADLALAGVVVAAIVRDGRRTLAPPPTTPLAPGDAVVLFGSAPELAAAEQVLRA